MLLALYGCDLPTEDHHKAWAILQGQAEYDELGYPTKVYDWPYTPKEYSQMWSILGRRSGKSHCAALVIAYESLLGGHLDYVTPGQETVIYYVAQKLEVAKANLKFVKSFFHLIPLFSRDNDIASESEDRIVLTSGVTVIASPPSLRGQRGLAVPVAIMDEVGYWYSDPDAANPDVEVENAIAYAQLQFPNYKRIGISTPWTKEGLLWKYWNAGTEGVKVTDRSKYEGILVNHAPTAAMENPHVKRKFLAKERQRDPDIFERESLARFVDSISNFLPEALVTRSVIKGVALHPPQVGKRYVAAMDPAFRHDSFAFAICHKEAAGQVVLDVILRWVPQKTKKLNPVEILREIYPWLRQYNITVVLSDQYQLEALQQIAQQFGFVIEGMDFTGASKAKIFGDTETLFKTGRIKIPDPEMSVAVKELITELIRLEKVNTGQGRVQIGAPRGYHDDLATALALGAHRCLWQDPEPVVVESDEPPTMLQRYLGQLEKAREQFQLWD